MPRKRQQQWKSGEQNDSISGQCGGTGARAEPGWIAGCEMDTMVVVRWQEGGRRLTDGGTRFRKTMKVWDNSPGKCVKARIDVAKRDHATCGDLNVQQLVGLVGPPRY